MADAKAESAFGSEWRHYDNDQISSPILDAALSNFVDYGYHGTTVRMIAATAGLSVPGLYYHFTSKQDMLIALLRASNLDIMERSRVAREQAGLSPRARFVALVENIVLYMANRRRLALLGREVHCLEEPYRQQHTERRDELQRMVLTEVVGAKYEGHFSADDPHEATRAVWVLCRGVAEWFSPLGSKTPEELVRDYVRFSLAIVGDIPRTDG